ncbi:DUF4351 domain-containing protein [Halopseudomonas bauzanensis]|uniref:DUF4351 domain-containing protein n=1 Tax=Halopseudomonas bauzanensis TaxID=653930 RepID=A0A1I4JM93_9GAMM|nr:DUF4351 domain-containing protein [Halopseudomonas bauzanensis]SER58279.1 protein of unknown function [Halopseudomonas bauzanensis]SFL67226.1 protein of unknown function [Halopseudomonas bauzanensis]
MAHSHDQNFKNLILDYPQQALEFFAAQEAVGLDQQVRITAVRQEQLKERLGDHFRELDVPLLVEWPDGRRETLLFAIEEETDPTRFSIRRLAHYCLDLTELMKTDRIVPVVIFLRTSKHIPRYLELGGDRHTYLSFHYLSCELSRLEANDWLHSPNLVARLNLPNMHWQPEQKIDIYASAVRGLQEMEPDLDKQVKYLDFIDIYTALDDNDMREYQERYPQETNKMSGLRERWLSEGKEQGIAQGIEQGERSLLYRQLTRRFGPLDAPTEARLQRATAAELERWADNILEAHTLEEVFTLH